MVVHIQYLLHLAHPGSKVKIHLAHPGSKAKMTAEEERTETLEKWGLDAAEVNMCAKEMVEVGTPHVGKLKDVEACCAMPKKCAERWGQSHVGNLKTLKLQAADARKW
jgi:hypothetical protein